MEQVENLQKKLNASKGPEEMNESLNRIFSEEKRINTGHFNSKVQLELEKKPARQFD